MPEVVLADRADVGGLRKTADGYLVAQVRVAKGGNVQVYRGSELGMNDRQFVRLYRPPEVVFDQAVMRGWAYKPVTYLHPASGSVTADNWKETAVGMAGSEVMRDGEFVSVPLCLMDGDAIDAVQSKEAVEVSCGYRIALDATPGATEDGREYDAKVTSIVPNHIAVVPKGRAGSECRIGDTAPKLSPPTPAQPSHRSMLMPPEGTSERAVTVLVDGFTIETSQQGREAINRLQTQVNDHKSALDAAQAEHRKVVDGLNGQLAAALDGHKKALDGKDGEIAGLKLTHQQALDAANAKIAELEARTSPQALEAAAAQRAATIQSARRVLGDAFTGQGMSDADIRKAVVVAALGDAEGRDAAYFDNVFDAISKMVPVGDAAPAPRHDPLRSAIAAGAGAPVVDNARREPTAFEKLQERQRNAWKGAA